MKDIDYHLIEPLLTELEDSMSDRRRDQLTEILRYATPDALDRAIKELRKLKDKSK